MKKFIVLLFSMAMVIGMSTEPNGNMVYAAGGFFNVSELDNNPTEKSKAEFAYLMAQITARVVSVPKTDVNTFKVEFAYATAQVTTKILPIIHSSQRSEFAYEMAQLTAKILNDQNLDIEKAKIQFVYDCQQLTAKIINNADNIAIGKTLKVQNNYIEPKAADKTNYTNIDSQTALLRNDAAIERNATVKVNSTDTNQKASVNTSNISRETYNGLIGELQQVGNSKNDYDKKVTINGEVRYHYAVNRGYDQWNYDSSGIRTYLGFGANINKDWRANAMVEAAMDLGHYYDKFDLTRWNLVGKVGISQVTAGSFGYLMAEGNIYDSGFKGVRVDLGDTVKYTMSAGKTEATKDTLVVTARYNDFDYNLESGVYRFKRNNDFNTIWSFGGTYNFSNFGVGAMYLASSQKDANGANSGYVFKFTYGDLKTWRPGTYNIFAKYYNQPIGTYITHGMYGVGGIMNGGSSLMQGFRGYGVGMRYTFAKDLVGAIEYYDLSDKINGNKGTTWWGDVTHYF